MFKDLLGKVVENKNLSREESMEAMKMIMEGEATPAQIASFITAMRMKGETIEEITGFTLTMRSKADSLNVDSNYLVDTCGTGGDGGITFNISTASAILAAAGDVRIAKHGNRAVSSKSGSADVLEALGISIQLQGDQAIDCLQKTNLCFMFAPLYHQAMKHAVGPRKEVGFRSFFNLLGPLTNPAGADRQLIGIYDASLLEKVAHVLKEIGLKRALVVSGMDGLDEISISGPTHITELFDQKITSYEITPEQVGLKRYPLSEVAGGSAEINADIMKRIFFGEKSAYRDIVCFNSGAVFYLAEKVDSIEQGVRMAEEMLDSGKALAKLNQLIKVTGDVHYAS